MTILRIELCGRLAEACGCEVEQAVPTDGLPVHALFAALADAHPRLGEVLARGRVRACVNEESVPGGRVGTAGDPVALSPPVSGG